MNLRSTILEALVSAALKTKGPMKWLAVSVVTLLAATNPIALGLVLEAATALLEAAAELPGVQPQPKP
jgi:hypothetical protein